MSEHKNQTNSPIALEQLERLFEYSPLIGGNQLIGLSDIRSRQDERMTARISRQALRLIQDESLITLQGDEFFVGSVDFMVSKSPQGGLQYTVLETNGGSNRGYSSLAVHDLDQVCNGYLEILRFIDDPSPVILLGHPKDDALLAEKIYLAERLRASLLSEGLCESAEIIPLEDFRGILSEGEGVIVFESYAALLPALVGAEDNIILRGHPVDAIIGDGVARRHYQMGRGERFDVVLTNWSFPVTDDKYLTYRAVEMAADHLAPFDVYPLQAWRADTIDDLMEICEQKRAETDLIIKPFRGSGGAGVHPIDEDSPISIIIEESMGEYRQKFGPWNNPFPYTVCEKVQPHRAQWRQMEHSFDIRTYVARDGDQLWPVGALFRVALEPHTGENRKRALVVNLSGYGGIDVERGLGVSDEALEITRLDEGDLTKMFAAATVLLSYIAKNHEGIK